MNNSEYILYMLEEGVKAIKNAQNNNKYQSLKEALLNEPEDITIKCNTVNGRFNSIIKVADTEKELINLAIRYGKYYINNMPVDKNTYLKALEIYSAGGELQPVVNSINDILNEYCEEKKKADEEARSRKLDEELARSKRIQELRKIIVDAQAELNKLDK